MAVAIRTEPAPLRVDDDGVLRIGPTRVTLDTVVCFFREGVTPEEIMRRFDSLRLEDVYSTIGYYLRHRQELDAYLGERAERGNEVLKEVQRELPYSEFKARLIARQEGSPHPPTGG